MEKLGKFDLILEETGVASVAMAAQWMLNPNGVLSLLGVYGGKEASEDIGTLFRDVVLGNKIFFGSVNANRKYFEMGLRDFGQIEEKFSGSLQQLITGVLAPQDFPKAYQPSKDDIKLVIDFGNPWSLMGSIFDRDRFSWGVNIDDMWTYAGFPPPKSIIIPYLLSVKLPRGPVEWFSHPEMEKLGKLADRAGDESELEREAEAASRDLASILKAAGISFVRCWFQWNFFQPKIQRDAQIPVDYEFPLDGFVSALKSVGIEILAVLGNGYSRFLPEGLNPDHVPDYVRRLTDCSRAVVRHHKDSIKTWQIENEPNWWGEHYSAHWRTGAAWLEPGMDDLILGSLREAVRSEDPSAVVVVNLEADRKKTQWNRYAKYCDVIGLDFYPNYSHAEPIGVPEMQLAGAVGKETGLPVFIAETGYPSGPRLFGYSEENQARYVKLACEEASSSDALRSLCLWRFSDSYWRSFPDQENHFGLLSKEWKPKMVWAKYASRIRAAR